MKRKERPVYEHKSNGREYLKTLIWNPKYCQVLEGNNKAYQTLLDWIIKFGNEYNDDTIIPDIKKIAKEINVKYSYITKYLKDIYFDILEHNNSNPLTFVEENESLCCLYINYLGSYGYLNVGLRNIPRKGEHFVVPFILPKVGSDWFYVQRIRHEMVNGSQTTAIDLSSTEPNSYLQLLKEKAYLNKELHWSEYHDELDNEAKERLISRGL